MTTATLNKTEHNEKWYKKAWRPMLAFVYASIVVFDFVIMPAVIEASNQQASNQEAVELSLKFTEPTAQVKALDTFTEKRSWSPLTLLGGGLFHIAFGTLLTGAAVTRGLEKKQHAENGTFMN